MTHVGGVCSLSPYYSRVRRINNLSSITIIRQFPRPVIRYISALEYTDSVHKANALQKEQCVKFNSTYLRRKGLTNCTDNIFLNGVLYGFFFLPKNTWDQEPKFKTVEQDGQLMFVKTKDTAKAFHVSVAIYCQKHPEM